MDKDAGSDRDSVSSNSLGKFLSFCLFPFSLISNWHLISKLHIFLKGNRKTLTKNSLTNIAEPMQTVLSENKKF